MLMKHSTKKRNQNAKSQNILPLNPIKIPQIRIIVPFNPINPADFE